MNKKKILANVYQKVRIEYRSNEYKIGEKIQALGFYPKINKNSRAIDTITTHEQVIKWNIKQTKIQRESVSTTASV